MSQSTLAVCAAKNAVSPLMLADRLLSLAEEAERSGLHRPAEHLLRLAYAVCDEKPFGAAQMFP